MTINLISGPRNISTALMYAFAQRSDTKVVDEPFYGHYLLHTGHNHPGRDEILHHMKTTAHEVLDEIAKLNKKHEVLFLKNMAHHHEGIDWSYLTDMINVFLIRNPQQLIASFAQVIPNPTLADIGLKHEAELLDHVLEYGTHPPIVVDSHDILAHPKKGLDTLCQKIGIPFEPGMCSWNPGPIPEDGIWAKYWYKNVHNSSGFQRQPTSERPLPNHCYDLLHSALPYYEKLKSFAQKMT